MQVIIAPDQRLRVKTKPVKKITPHLLQKIKEMVKLTKTFSDPEGVGLASTQVGDDGQYFVAKNEQSSFASQKGDGSFTPVFNPKILTFSKKTKSYFEGCLSIPNYYGEVKRHSSITVSFLDKDGNPVKKRLTGFSAWIFQHEMDHLQGKLFIDLVMEQKSRLFKVVGKDRAGADMFKEVAV